MLTKNTVDMNELLRYLQDRYTLSIASILPWNRGFDGETFLAYDQDSKVCYFVKCVTSDMGSISALQTAYYISQKLSFVPSILPDRFWIPYSTYKSHYVVVMEYIDATQTFDYSQDEFVLLLAQLHAIQKDASISTDIETFDFTTIYNIQLQSLVSLRPQNKHLSTLWFYSYITTKLPLRNTLRVSFHALCQVLQRSPAKQPFVYTHGDSACNVLRKNHGWTLRLVDWDGVMLAPMERDLWFCDDIDLAMNLYILHNPQANINPQLISYYVYQRYFSDIFDYANLIHTHNDLSIVEQSFFDMKHEVDGRLQRKITKHCLT